MESVYVHHVPGRLRIRISRLRHDEQAARAAEALMVSVPGVQKAATNTVTGSLTVHYDRGKTCVDELLPVLKGHQYIDTRVTAPALRTTRSVQTTDVAVRVVSRLARMAAEKALERSVMSLVAALL
jgi:Heavy metal associated domain 2